LRNHNVGVRLKKLVGFCAEIDARKVCQIWHNGVGGAERGRSSGRLRCFDGVASSFAS
jgi:hypothetical protein